MNNSKHFIWVIFGALVGFGSSFIFGDLLTLPVDLYYLIYFGIIITFFMIYITRTQLKLKEWFFRRLAWGIALGLIFGALMAQNVLSRPETEKFTGGYLAWLIFWRGLVYGTIDGFLLSSFPWIVTWRAFDVEKKPWGKKIASGFLAWLLILVVTTAYHVGYSDFRSRKIIQPNIGNTIISLPTLISGNPIGSPITHAIMHITAIIHCPETELFLPPHRDQSELKARSIWKTRKHPKEQEKSGS
jgi:hypothetical protein